MGSGSYSFAAYASLASDRGYATKSADAVFTNHSLSAKSDIKLSNINATGSQRPAAAIYGCRRP